MSTTTKLEVALTYAMSTNANKVRLLKSCTPPCGMKTDPLHPNPRAHPTLPHGSIPLHPHLYLWQVLLLKFCTDSFIERGANLAYLSAFPEEEECLFPPLTYMKPPAGGMRQETFFIGSTRFRVIEVKPTFGT